MSAIQKTMLIAILVIFSGCTIQPTAQPPVPSVTAAGPATAPPASSTNSPTPSQTPTITATLRPSITPTRTFTPTATPLSSLTVAGEGASLRTGPGLLYPSQGELSVGERLKIVSRYLLDWVQVQAGEQTGWVRRADLDASPEIIGQIPAFSGKLLEPPPPVPGWRGARIPSICLQLKSAFTGRYIRENPSAQPPAGADSDLRSLLESMNIQVSEAGDICAATLSVDLSIDMTGQNMYGTVKPTFCYSGVVVTGKFKLDSGAQHKQGSATKKKNNVYSLKDCPKQSQYQDAQTEAMVLGLKEIWGDYALLALTSNPQSEAAKIARRLLLDPKATGTDAPVDLIAYAYYQPDPDWGKFLIPRIQKGAGLHLGDDIFQYRGAMIEKLVGKLDNPDEMEVAQAIHDLRLLTRAQIGDNPMDWKIWWSAAGKPAVQDEFKDNQYGWKLNTQLETGAYCYSRRWIDGGVLHLNLKVKDEGCSWWMTVSDHLYDSMHLSADVRHISGTETHAGLIFGATSKADRYFYYSISDDGYFSLLVEENEKWSELIGWVRSSLIKPGQSNHLTVWVMGNTISLFINDSFARATDTELNLKGSVGVEMSIHSQDAEWQFDNFELSEGFFQAAEAP